MRRTLYIAATVAVLLVPPVALWWWAIFDMPAEAGWAWVGTWCSLAAIALSLWQERW